MPVYQIRDISVNFPHEAYACQVISSICTNCLGWLLQGG